MPEIFDCDLGRRVTVGQSALSPAPVTGPDGRRLLKQALGDQRRDQFGPSDRNA